MDPRNRVNLRKAFRKAALELVDNYSDLSKNEQYLFLMITDLDMQIRDHNEQMEKLELVNEVLEPLLSAEILQRIGNKLDIS